MRIGKDWMVYILMMRLGQVSMEAMLQIPPVSFMNDDEARAGVDGSSAPDTASDDK